MLAAAVCVALSPGAPASAGTGPAPATTAVGAAAAPDLAPSAEHPYSDPHWWPLRRSTVVTCIKTNCSSRGSAYHGYWALDADGTKGDPIFAAGAGVFHVGSVGAGCRASDTSEDDGTWAWVDHGAGVVTRYHHLLALTAREGEYVTPATQIATMGVSGTAPCTTAYLHLEVRHGGVKGTRVDPGQLTACVAGRARQWPAAWGLSSWDALRQHQVTGVTSSSCVTPGWTSTPARPGGVRALRGSGSATVTWPKAPAGTDSVTIATSTYHPSVPEWGAPTYRVRSGSATSSAFTGLQNGRSYRFRISFHNAEGSSSSSAWVTVVPAAKPSVPRSPRWLTATIHQVRFAWYKSTEHGTPTTSYTVGLRKKLSSGYGPWMTTKVSRTTLNKNFTGVRRGATYQVRVRANSAVGATAYTAARSVRVPKG
ncbi:hypothetical protein GCM10028814_14210 [Angustibacter aerolatus]